MQIRNDNELIDVKSCYESKQKSLEYLGDKNELFWNYINLSVYTYKIIDESKELKFSPFSLNLLFYNFINHIVTSYKLLTENMEQEYLIMLRQSYEVLWLQKYFIKHKDKEHNWVLQAYKPSKYNRIEPWLVRNAFPSEKEYMNEIYGRLSDFVHSNFRAFGGVALGGFYNEYVLDVGIRHIIVSIHEMLQLLYKILSHKDNKLLVYSKANIYNVNNDLSRDPLYYKLNVSLDHYRKLAARLPELFVERDYEKEALDKLIKRG
jgi:hypothetical protein